MQKREKGDFGYLAYKKKLNLILFIASFIVVFIVLAIGMIVAGTKNNIGTVMAILLVLPAAKFAVAYFVIAPHKGADITLKDELESDKMKLLTAYDLVFSNSKKPIGTLAVVVSDTVVCALAADSKADVKLFETSLKEFMERDRRKVNVSLYTDKAVFLKRVSNLNVNYNPDENADEIAEYNMHSLKNMCL